MTAQPAEPHPDPQPDPRDPRTILAEIPEHARPNFLAQYRDAVEAAQDPAEYPALQKLLRYWAIKVKVYRQRPNYDEEVAAATEEVRSGAAQTVPIEEALAQAYGISVPEATKIWEGKVAEARAKRQRRAA